MSNEVVIAGGGIAGLYVARQLADLQIPSIVIEPKQKSDTLESLVVSTPFIKIKNANQIGIDIPMQAVISVMKNAVDSPMISIFPFLVDIVNIYLERNPMCAPLYQELTEKLSTSVRDRHGYINVISNRVSNVVLEGNTVKSVKIGTGTNTQEIDTAFVIDATGRSSTIVKKLVDTERPAIQEKKEHHDSRIIGGYLQIDADKLQKLGIQESSLYFDRLPNELFQIFIPTVRTNKSEATHLILIEGDSTLIQQAYKQSDQNRFMAMRMLMAGTVWPQLITSEMNFEASVYFQHTSTVFRGVNQQEVKGLALIGDSQGYENPIRGSGIEKTMNDVDTFIRYLKRSGSLETAFTEYNNRQNKLLSTRMRNANLIRWGLNHLPRV